MGVVGSVPLSNETDNKMISDVVNDDQIECSHEQVPYARLCMKELQVVAARLENRRYLKSRRSSNEKMVKGEFRCEKHRRITRKLASKRYIIREQLRKKVQELVLEQNHLLSTVQQLHHYKQELEVAYRQISSNHELLK